MLTETILHLDTTTSQLHLALSQGGEPLLEVRQPCESHRYHSAILVPAIQDMLKSAGLAIQDLTALAVNQGPGSFTGIRTGIITVRTMAQFLNLPVYQFNIFELLASQHQESAPAIDADADADAATDTAIYLDALRGRAYHARLRLSDTGAHYEQTPTLIDLKTPKQPFKISPETICVASPGLATYFEGQAAQLISEDWRPLPAMLRLIQQAPPAYCTEWQNVKPLYVQEPSITLKNNLKRPIEGK